jgi:aminocarboxymuconate-semialdehyde decarboxylase
MIIDFETHYYPKEYIEKLKSRYHFPRFLLDSAKGLMLEYDSNIKIPRQNLMAKFSDVETRKRDMQNSGIDMQVLSVPLPGADLLEPEYALKTCAVANDELSNICEKNQSIFRGFALLPIQSGSSAVDELRRSIKDLGLSGGYLHSNSSGVYLDSKTHLELFNAAASLDVPIFVHPTIPFKHEDMQQHRLASTFGLQMDLSLSLLRLVFSGALESLPNLKIIVSHLGRTLPFISNRLDDEFGYAKAQETKIPKKPSEYLKRLYVDTVTMDGKPLEFAAEYYASGHIMFGSDYPFWDSSLHLDAIRNARISEEQREGIYWKTAADLLRIS